MKQLLPKIEPLPRRPKGHIMVLTPMGEVRVLQDGATPVDFAYAIHRELGVPGRDAAVERASGTDYSGRHACNVGALPLACDITRAG